MNKKLSTILIALGMVAPLMGGCAPVEEPLPPAEDVVVPLTPDMPAPAEVDEDYFDIDVVPTTPVADFSDEVKTKLHEAFTYLGMSKEDVVVKALLDAKFSNEQAMLLAETMLDVASMVRSPVPEKLKEAIAHFLSLLNSVTNQQLSIVMNTIEVAYEQGIREEIKENDKFFYNRYYFDSVSYQDYDKLHALVDGCNNAELTRRANIIFDVYDNLVFTEEQTKAIADEKAYLEAKLARGLFPQITKDYITQHGNDLTSYLVKAFQILGGAFVEKYTEAYGEGPTKHEIEIKYDYYGEVGASVNINDILGSFTFTDIKNMALALFGKCQDNAHMLNVVRNVVLPMLFNINYAEDETVRNNRDALLQKLAGFTDTALDTSVKFVLKVLQEINEEDFERIKDDEDEAFLVLKEKVDTLISLVNGLSQKEKDDVQQFGNIFNINIFSTISDILARVAATDFTDKEKAEKFKEYLEDLGEELSEKFNKVINGLRELEEEVEPSLNDEERYYLETKNIHVGDVLVAENVTVRRESDYVTIPTENISSVVIDTSKPGFVILSVTFTDNEKEVTATAEKAVYPVIKDEDKLIYNFDPIRMSGEGTTEWVIAPDEHNILYATFNYYLNDLECATIEYVETVGVYFVGDYDFYAHPQFETIYEFDMGFGLVGYDYNGKTVYKSYVPEVNFEEVGVHKFEYFGHEYTVETFDKNAGELVQIEIMSSQTSQIATRLETENDFEIEVTAYKRYVFHGQAIDYDYTDYASTVTLTHVCKDANGVISFVYNNETYSFYK